MSHLNTPPLLDKYLGLTVAVLLTVSWVLSAWLYGDKGIYLMAAISIILISVIVHFGAKFLRDRERNPPK